MVLMSLNVYQMTLHEKVFFFDKVIVQKYRKAMVYEGKRRILFLFFDNFTQSLQLHLLSNGYFSSGRDTFRTAASEQKAKLISCCRLF